MKSHRLLIVVLFVVGLSAFVSQKDNQEVIQTIGEVEFTQVELDSLAQKLTVSPNDMTF